MKKEQRYRLIAVFLRWLFQWKCDHPGLKTLESIEKEHIYIGGVVTCSHPYHKICMVCGTKI